MAKEFAADFYSSSAWHKAREAYGQSKFWLCEQCHKHKKIMIVHHKIRLTPENINDPDVTLNFKNFQLLCIDCHNSVYNQACPEGFGFDEDGNFGPL